MTQPHMPCHRLLLLIGAVAAILGGCATGGETQEGRHIVDVRSALEEGTIRLNCQISCAFAWGMERSKSKRLYEQRLWTDLATTVTRVGFEGDLPYFYLARAAEGLGYSQAANTYYRLALSASYRCGGINCDGIEPQKEARVRLASLAPVQSRKPADADADRNHFQDLRAADAVTAANQERTAKLSSDKADKAALLRQIDELYKSGRAREAVATALPLAEQGDPEFEFQVAAMYRLGGTDLPKDPDKSKKWLERAAAHGHENAQALIRSDKELAAAGQRSSDSPHGSRIVVGMSKADVRGIPGLGEPSEVIKANTARGVTERWFYGGSALWVMIWFDESGHVAATNCKGAEPYC